MQAGPKNISESDQNPKNSPAGPKKDVEDPKWGRIRNKKIGLYFQNQSLQPICVGLNKLFEPDSNPKNNPVWAYKATNGVDFKTIKQNYTFKSKS